MLFAVVLAGGCGRSEDQAPAGHGAPGAAAAGESGPPGEGDRPAVPVAVERAKVGQAASYYSATATLEAASHAEILSRTTGVVREIQREEGDLVREGDTLLLLEDDEARLRVQQAEANHRLAKADFDRRSAMLEGGLLSAGEFETTQGTLEVREAELGLARVALAHTRIVAPFTGRVVRRHAELGANVSAGAPLFEMMDVTPLLARIHIPAKRMGYVVVGQPIEIRVDSIDDTLDGVVSLVSPIVDAATGTVKVTAEIARYPEDTRPGDFAEVRIVTARHDNAVLVPSTSLFEEQGESVLFVVQDGKAARRVVEQGFIDGDFTEIAQGVSEGDLVVTKGQRQIQDGAAVSILEGPPDVIAKSAEPEAGAKRDAS
ncbi:MAG: efflux RND transporter periplasmic adaptor subunit [Candidatus Eiseniibacteriota bacterium]